MTRGRVLYGVTLTALVLTLGAVYTARAGDDGNGKKHADKKMVIFRSGGSWLGVQIADLDADRGKELGLKDVHGAEVQSVSPGSPAEAAGVQEGDVITEYQGTRVEGVAQLSRLVRETPAGRTATLKVFRGGSSKELQATMKAHEDQDMDSDGNMHWMNVPAPPAPPGVDLEGLEERLQGLNVLGIPGGGRPRLGINVDTIGKQLSDYFGLKQNGGVLVTSVSKGGQGESAGLKAGDVIVKVDDEAVTDTDDLHRAMQDRRSKAVTLTIVRDRREQTLKVPEPPAAPEPPDTPKAQRHAYERDMQRALEAARVQALAAKQAAMVDVQKALRASEKAYRDAMRESRDTATRMTVDQQRKVQEQVRRALEQLRNLGGSIDDSDSDNDSDNDNDNDNDRDVAPAPDARPISDPGVSTPRGSEEERAAIRRAVEEARRLRIETQDAVR
jgi:hypothetical protein